MQDLEEPNLFTYDFSFTLLNVWNSPFHPNQLHRKSAKFCSLIFPKLAPGVLDDDDEICILYTASRLPPRRGPVARALSTTCKMGIA